MQDPAGNAISEHGAKRRRIRSARKQHPDEYQDSESQP
jgi:hypothetical protein